jgi:hypothetical protein
VCVCLRGGRAGERGGERKDSDGEVGRGRASVVGGRRTRTRDAPELISPADARSRARAPAELRDRRQLAGPARDGRRKGAHLMQHLDEGVTTRGPGRKRRGYRVCVCECGGCRWSSEGKREWAEEVAAGPGARAPWLGRITSDGVAGREKASPVPLRALRQAGLSLGLDGERDLVLCQMADRERRQGSVALCLWQRRVADTHSGRRSAAHPRQSFRASTQRRRQTRSR